MQLRIYQVSKDSSYRFTSYNFAQEHGFDLEHYTCILEEDVKSDTNLDDVYHQFKISLSDIVELNGKKHYCDLSGWIEIK